MDKLRTLEAAKDRAMMSEDIEEVKRLNEAIERLKLVGSKIRFVDHLFECPPSTNVNHLIEFIFVYLWLLKRVLEERKQIAI